MPKTYLKALFDIQRVHVDGSALHYELMYKQGNTYIKVAQWEFGTRQCAINYRDMHLLEG